MEHQQRAGALDAQREGARTELAPDALRRRRHDHEVAVSGERVLALQQQIDGVAEGLPAWVGRRRRRGGAGVARGRHRAARVRGAIAACEHRRQRPANAAVDTIRVELLALDDARRETLRTTGPGRRRHLDAVADLVGDEERAFGDEQHRAVGILEAEIVAALAVKHADLVAARRRGAQLGARAAYAHDVGLLDEARDGVAGRVRHVDELQAQSQAITARLAPNHLGEDRWLRGTSHRELEADALHLGGGLVALEHGARRADVDDARLDAEAKVQPERAGHRRALGEAPHHHVGGGYQQAGHLCEGTVGPGVDCVQAELLGAAQVAAPGLRGGYEVKRGAARALARSQAGDHLLRRMAADGERHHHYTGRGGAVDGGERLVDRP
ncbi:MAG: hypothetical protein A2138_05935 [Deltaproteobacteria bacterium RBG_16_71_12]|nr:MAG: hypothetical protein A2138_05935 [Deltaproteobacteria bacterium RBG_16_71_12]